MCKLEVWFFLNLFVTFEKQFQLEISGAENVNKTVQSVTRTGSQFGKKVNLIFFPWMLDHFGETSDTRCRRKINCSSYWSFLSSQLDIPVRFEFNFCSMFPSSANNITVLILNLVWNSIYFLSLCVLLLLLFLPFGKCDYVNYESFIGNSCLFLSILSDFR